MLADERGGRDDCTQYELAAANERCSTLIWNLASANMR